MLAIPSYWARRLVIAIAAVIGVLALVAVTALASGSHHATHNQADISWTYSVPVQ